MVIYETLFYSITTFQIVAKNRASRNSNNVNTSLHPILVSTVELFRQNEHNGDNHFWYNENNGDTCVEQLTLQVSNMVRTTEKQYNTPRPK